MKLPFKLPARVVKLGMKLGKISPELCLIGGLVTGAACVVTACCATLKSEPTVKEAKEKIEDIKGTCETDEETGKLIIGKEEKAEIMKYQVDTAVTVVKNFAVPIMLGIVSTLLHIGDNRILRGRLAMSAAAYAGLLESFNEYRRRVREDGGEDKDNEYLYGIKKKTIEVVDEDGNVSTKEIVETDNKRVLSPFARMFNEGTWDSIGRRWRHRNFAWKDDPYKNLKFLEAQEKYANVLLRTREDGIVFLNEVYSMLGLPLTYEGQMYGWSRLDGDTHISFGIFDEGSPLHKLPMNKRFLTGYSTDCLLDFNCTRNVAETLKYSSEAMLPLNDGTTYQEISHPWSVVN